ncbi:response regulator, partial [Acinetobacter baumannii]|uniref:response regulator n=1 Tax=Acinetobacter baumannii TaxID=470 RepID=UPI003757376D
MAGRSAPKVSRELERYLRFGYRWMLNGGKMSSDKVQILVVDDDVSHCTILQALLRGWGYQVGLAHNGLQALEQIHQQVFDLVLCDIRMVEMDGIAMVKEIQAYNSAIPVLIMMVFSSVGTVARRI